MPELTNAEAQRANAALHEIAKTKIAMDGAFKVRRLLRELAEHLGDVEDIRVETLRGFAARNEDNKPIMDRQGNIQFKGDEERRKFADFFAALMNKTHEYAEALCRKDFGEQSQIEPELLFQLGDLLVDEERE